jgi:hypothetical protein
MVRSKACWAKAVSLSKVMDLRSAGSTRAKTASMTEMVSAAVFPASRAASVTRDLRMENEHRPRALTNDEGDRVPSSSGPSVRWRLGASHSLYRPGADGFSHRLVDAKASMYRNSPKGMIIQPKAC